MKKIIFLICSFFIFLTNAKAETFSDIPEDFWAYKEISSVTDKKYLSGYTDGTFQPNKLVTRAEYAAMVIKTIEQENITIDKMYSFEDIKNTHWAWPYVIRAINLDILLPVDEFYFYPDDYVTRADVITFLVNILRTEDISKRDAISALQNAYSDFDDIPDWFKITAGKAEYLNVIAKEPPRQNYLDCDSYVTRAQMAVFMHNLKREIDAYIAQEIKEKTSPKIAEGLVIPNTTQEGDIVTLPPQSMLPIIIMGQLSSKKSYSGDMFKARFPNNIIDEKHQLLLSKDLVLVGKILEAKKGKVLLKNGQLLIEVSSASNKNIITKIMGYAQFDVRTVKTNKFRRGVVKGKNFEVKDGEVIYIRLFEPMRINVVTGEVLD